MLVPWQGDGWFPAPSMVRSLHGVPEDYDSWAAMGNNQWGFRGCCPIFASWKMTRLLLMNSMVILGPSSPTGFRATPGFRVRSPSMRRVVPPGSPIALTIIVRNLLVSAPPVQQPRRHSLQHCSRLLESGQASAEPDHSGQLSGASAPVPRQAGYRGRGRARRRNLLL